MDSQKQILLTNDDGIDSPGLWAAAEALRSLGVVHIIAPRQQHSGAGRSMPNTSDGIIQEKIFQNNGHFWKGYAVGGSPAQTVEHAILEILPCKPDVIISGINFGENLGVGITASGTIGAAMEGALFGIPALAVSLETPPEYYFSHNTDIDFQTAAYFTHLFTKIILEKVLPRDVDLLKVDVPTNATPYTAWKVTHLLRIPYYELTPPSRKDWGEPGKIGFRPFEEPRFPEGSDAFVMCQEKLVSVTPLSLDLTSRINLSEMDSWLNEKHSGVEKS